MIWGAFVCVALGVLTVSFARMNTSSKMSKMLFGISKYSETLIAQNYSLLEPGTRAEISDVDKARISKNAAEVLRKAPLNDDVLLQVAVSDFFETGAYTYSMSRKLNEAKFRNARNRKTLQHLFNFHILSGNYDEALRELDLLLRLNPSNSESYHQLLDRMYETPLGKTAINDYLKTDPRWSYKFLKHSISISDRKSLKDLKGPISFHLRKDKGNEKTLELVSLFLKKLVALDEFEEAYKFWNDNYFDQSETLTPLTTTVINPSFLKLEMPAPFNWRIYRSSSTSIEFDLSGGMFVSFNDNRPQLIAYQYTKIDAPLFMVKLDADLNFSARQGDFEWRLKCLKSGQTLTTISVVDASKMSAIDSIQTLDFTAKDCPFIDIQLWGVPGVFNDRISMILRQFDLIVADGAATAKVEDTPWRR